MSLFGTVIFRVSKLKIYQMKSIFDHTFYSSFCYSCRIDNRQLVDRGRIGRSGRIVLKHGRIDLKRGRIDLKRGRIDLKHGGLWF